ncbi:hypothetical protein [Secundilactobacillus kimchicus]|uniref:Uncharacterized protein n=1 Tax=Secundilactobacillus kimchicus JCM 15530 TaxID=1302272 RepID=A0A0R1HLM7_9LACO|nr:hypothetical protein [Secundilactobacillus kimchicus]KRK47414.1 hypothetical protein FC96_GL002533 [Secundilactobacillus kimchicus JCM 15530]MBT9672311.1 hypothetical protein [Secundilactobacillus kimchicus]
MNPLAELKTAYQQSKDLIMNQPLTTTQQAQFRRIQRSSTDLEQASNDIKLEAVYQALLGANLSAIDYQLFYVANLNHDHTWLTYPIEPRRVQMWRQTASPKLGLFSINAFMFEGVSIDETAALALL